MLLTPSALTLLANVSRPPNLSLSLLVKKKEGHLGVDFQLLKLSILSADSIKPKLNRCAPWSFFCSCALSGMDSVVKLGAYSAAQAFFSPPRPLITEGKTGIV